MRQRIIVTTGCAAIAAAVALAGCRGNSQATDTVATAPAPAPAGIGVEAVPSPAAASSMEPQLTVSSRGLLMSWVERQDDVSTLKFAERTASGWTPVLTAASGRNWFLSYADVPTVLRLSDGSLVAQWLQERDAALEAYDLALAYSNDNGAKWSSVFNPHHDKTITQHGFATLFELPGRALGLVWLDGRDQELDTSSPEGGSMALRYATFDKSWKQTADTPINARVCECCPTTVAITSDGLLTAFRDRSDKEIRDIAVSRLENDRWTEAKTVHDDQFEAFACPVNGPSLSAQGRQVAVSWFTRGKNAGENDPGETYVAFSADAGRTWDAPIRLDSAGSLGRADVELLPDGSALASWAEFADGRTQLRAMRVTAKGGKSAMATVAGAPGSTGRVAGFHRLARVGDELLFAWTESTAPAENSTDGVQQVKTAVARVPK